MESKPNSHPNVTEFPKTKVELVFTHVQSFIEHEGRELRAIQVFSCNLPKELNFKMSTIASFVRQIRLSVEALP
jgi:hypothetical protein